MSISVGLGKGVDPVHIDREVFTTLLENSYASTYAAYSHTLERGSITLHALQILARNGKIPYSLLFAPLPLVQAQVQAKTAKLLEGTGKDSFSVNSRHSVELRHVELIVMDLLRKQTLLKSCDDTLRPNSIVGMLGKPGRTVESDANDLMDAIGLAPAQLRSARTKEAALDLLIERLEANQILVARRAQHYMPQTLRPEAKLSGITISDKKIPYIFLGRESDAEEPFGRQVLTLTLLTVLIAHKIFKPVNYDARITGQRPGRHYRITEEILMPARDTRHLRLDTIDGIDAAANVFKVTPSAMTVRAWHLGKIDASEAQAHLAVFSQRYANRKKQNGASKFLPVNGVLRYAGKEYTSRMLGALDAGKVPPGQFYRAVCLNMLGPSQLGDLRTALQ
ncbi:hypothetical protein ACIQYZ_13470 [Rhodococcus erythropolis]